MHSGQLFCLLPEQAMVQNRQRVLRQSQNHDGRIVTDDRSVGAMLHVGGTKEPPSAISHACWGRVPWGLHTDIIIRNGGENKQDEGLAKARNQHTAGIQVALAARSRSTVKHMVSSKQTMMRSPPVITGGDYRARAERLRGQSSERPRPSTRK